MKIVELISNLNNLGKFIGKDYELPFLLRRGIKKNYSMMLEEYKIFEETKKPLVEGYDEKSDEEKATIDEKCRELLNTEIGIELIKVDVNVLTDVKMPYKDELLIEFMLNEED